MIKKLSFLFLLSFLAFTSKSQIKVTTSVEFDHLEYNFGKVYAGDSAVHAFKFKNTGNNPLKIKEIKTTCSCTASKWPKEEIAPGASSEIVVSFDTKDKNGVYAKGINIFSNAGESNLIIDIQVLPKKK